METTVTNLVDGLYTGIEEFAQEFVGNELYHNKLPVYPKIIHDPLWGTIKLEPWEVALLNLPLFQRLRQIHQTSLVSYVFPGCSHTRFEHTLGVIQQTQRLIDEVNKQHLRYGSLHFDNITIRNLRLAALFHDCGHSCFSHLSEELYESCPDMMALKNAGNLKCNPHEAFSSLILKSKPVKDYIRSLEETYRNHSLNLDLDKAANWIIGKTEEGEPKKHYITQVINGPFDADKLDYIFRDAHYSGIPVGLDLERLWASCEVGKEENGDKVLTLQQASVAPLEQILFSKMNLFAIVYQHPKVRAVEKMFQAIIEKAKTKPDEFHFKISDRQLNLNKATDYLWLTDEVFFSEAWKRPREDSLHKRLHDIKYRRLLVRALTISYDTISKVDNEGEIQFRKLNQRNPDTFRAKRNLANNIIEAAGLEKELQPEDVWVDLPSDPSFGEADRTKVRTANNSLRKVSDLFPVNYWSKLYHTYKWRGHVFCPQKFQQKIYEASLEVFKKEFGMRFKISAGETAHVTRPLSSE